MGAFQLLSRHPLSDEPVAARIVGLAPGELVTVTATSFDAAGTRFSSWGTYHASDEGEVDPARHAAVQGSYAGVDAFGLWWSMSSEPRREIAPGIDPIATRLFAEVAGQRVAEVALERVHAGPGVRRTTLQEEGLVGTMFTPPGGPAPAVIVLGGSGGGLHASLEMAALLGSHGFAALALAYFGLPGLPAALADIPIEYFERAITWMLGCDQVSGEGVAIIGASRGGELALLLGATQPRISAVVALAPSSVLWDGFDPHGRRQRPAWRLGGKPLPHLRLDRRVAGAVRQRGGTMADIFLGSLNGGRRAERATIPVERISGAVMLVSGGDDHLWPSAHFAEMIMRRLGGTAERHRHLHYPRAGHAAGRPPGLPASDGFAVHPVDGMVRAVGGTRAANAASSVDAWPRVLDFLRGHLGAEG